MENRIEEKEREKEEKYEVAGGKIKHFPYTFNLFNAAIWYRQSSLVVEL